MALMFPDSIPQKASLGEKKLYGILRDRLPDNFLVWYEPLVKGRMPDFVIVSPTFGLLILEVKGWSDAQIIHATPDGFEIKDFKSGQTEPKSSPLRQANEYFRVISDKLKEDPILRQSEGQHQGKPCCPIGWGVVMSNMTAVEAKDRNILPILPQPQVAYKDDLEEWMSFGEQELIQRLEAMFVKPFRFKALTDDQISIIKGALYPESIVCKKAATIQSVPPGIALPPDASVLVTLDAHQEQLARSLKGGHRVLAGVAGSGKTLILLARAKILANQNPNHQILVLCFTIALAASLRSLLERDTHRSDYHTQIQVIHFNDWAKSLLGRLPVPSDKLCGEAYDELLGAKVLEVLSHTTPDRKWDAVLIDEAHTFHPNWFQCCINALKDPEEGDLLIVSDANQRLFERRDFTWKSVGVKAQGRTIKLAENYRNTQEILAAAWSVLELTPNTQLQSDAQTFPVIEPSAARQHGDLPILHRTNNKTHSLNAVLRHVSDLIQSGCAPEDIAILYQRKDNHDSSLAQLLSKLEERQIRAYWVAENEESKRNYGHHVPGVRLITAQSSLGLEFRVVLILGLEQFDGCCTSTNAAEAARLRRELYVAMTRAQETLYLLGRSDSRIVTELQESQYFKTIGAPAPTSVVLV